MYVCLLVYRNIYIDSVVVVLFSNTRTSEDGSNDDDEMNPSPLPRVPYLYCAIIIPSMKYFVQNPLIPLG